MNNKYKILLVEDELNICNFIRTVLEANSYHIIDTQKAVTGLSLLKSHCPNLVILDLGLPDMDGTDFIRHRTYNGNFVSNSHYDCHLYSRCLFVLFCPVFWK